MDLQETQKAVQELLVNLKIDGTVHLDTHFDEHALRVEVKDLNPRLRAQLIETLEQYPNVELDHEYGPTLSQKAYDILRNQNPSHYIELDPNFTKVAYHETVSYGRKACELVQELLTGHSQYSSYLWKEEELINTATTALTVDEANALILANDTVTSLIFDDVRVIDYTSNESITIETDAYRSAFDANSGEIYGHFHADFTITAQNEVSVELCSEDGATIYSSGLAVIKSQDGDNIRTESDSLENILDAKAIECLSPSDDLNTALIALFKRQFIGWAFEDITKRYDLS
jgi:hypothetical protein